MQTIAIDIGATMGIAHGFTDSKGKLVVISEVVKLKSPDFGTRLLALEAELKRYPIYDVQYAVEIPHLGKFFAANKSLFGMLGIIYRRAALYHTPVFEYKPKAIKKWATGNGNASKEMMVARARELSGKNITDHNEADAYLLLMFHLSKGA